MISLLCFQQLFKREKWLVFFIKTSLLFLLEWCCVKRLFFFSCQYSATKSSGLICAIQSGYLKPKHDIFLTLTKCFLCLYLTTHYVKFQRIRFMKMCRCNTPVVCRKRTMPTFLSGNGFVIYGDSNCISPSRTHDVGFIYKLHTINE